MRLAISMIVALCATVSESWAIDCDKTLVPVMSANDLGYRDRGDRCEGLYQKDVGSTGLRIVGFHNAQNTIAHGSKLATVRTVGDSPKQLSIESTRKRLYYRLDARFAGRSFRYPLQVIRTDELRIEANELATVACVENCNGVRPTLVPVVVTTNADNILPNPFIVLQATSALQKLRIEIQDFATGRVLMDDQLLKTTTLEAWVPVEIPLAAHFAQARKLMFRATAEGSFGGQLDSVVALLQAE